MRWIADYTIGVVIVLVHLVMMARQADERALEARALRTR
jgi:hypothetical protein